MKRYCTSDVGKAGRTIASLGVGIACALLISHAAYAETIKVPNIQPDEALSAWVPKIYRDKGTLTVAVNPDVAPIKFIDDDGNIAGFTPDLLSAAAAILHLKLHLVQTSFDALMPGMAANRFDILLSLADFSARQKSLTFVDYLSTGETIVAQPAKPIDVKSLDDLCGLQLALVRGSAAVEEGAKVSARCVSGGKKGLNVSTYPDLNMALLSVTTAASDVAWVDSTVGYYNAAKFPEKYRVVYFYPVARYGIGFGVDPNSKQLAMSFQRALLKLHEDGVYESLFKKWGLSLKDGQATFPINGAKP